MIQKCFVFFVYVIIFADAIHFLRKKFNILMNINHNRLHGMKQIILIRHGTTEMNEALSSQPWGSKNFVDIGLWDTVLSSKGILQSNRLNDKLKEHNYKGNFEYLFDEHKLKLLVSSPLTRALQTSENVFKNISFFNKDNNGVIKLVPKVACELFSERLYLSSDVGRKADELQSEYPNWDFSNITKNKNWWYEASKEGYKEWRPNDNATYLCPGEPSDVFRNRLINAKQWLLSRPEEVVVVTTHWGVIRGLTGHSFENCEARLYQIDQLLDEPFIDT